MGNIIIGSWTEYLYPQLFETDFMPNIRTRDVDFFIEEDLLELEFLTRVIGAGRKNQNNIKSLGMKAEGLREINFVPDLSRYNIKRDLIGVK